MKFSPSSTKLIEALHAGGRIVAALSAQGNQEESAVDRRTLGTT